MQPSAAQPAHVRPPGPAARKGGMLGKLRYGLNFYLDPMGFVGGRFQRYGDVYFVGSKDGSQPGLFVLRHPDHLEEVLVTKARSFSKGHSAFATLSQVLGEGLLTTDGEVWRRQRRLVQPAFTRERLEEYATAMVEEAASEVAGWSAETELDVMSAMAEATLRIVCRTLFGYDSSGDAAQVRDSMNSLQGAIAGLQVPLPARISPGARRLKSARAALDAIMYRMIDARAPGAPHADLLQRLVDARDEDGSRLSREEIRDQLVTLFLAGHETTSNALTWTFHLLSAHPEVEARLHRELDEVLGSRLPRAEDLPRLPYTEHVFSESMRLFPPVYVLSRKATEDVEVGGWHVPAGSEVVMWLWHTHRDPRWWDAPWEFRPERFEREASEGRPRLAYAPFGAGPRACIGKVFAQWEGVLILATLAQRVRLQSTGGEVDLHPRVTLAPAGGLKMRVRLR